MPETLVESFLFPRNIPTMRNIISCVFLVICAFVGNANGQDCVPKAVENVVLTFMGRLSWTVREDETCEITHFMVHMSEPEEDARFIFKSFTTTLNVDFFLACELWHFNIVPHVGDVAGEGHLFITRIPVPQDANLSLRFLNVTGPNEDGDLHLEWDLNNNMFGECSLRYRVTVTGDDGDTITDHYSDEKSMNLHFLSPCVNYEFGVRTINFAHPTMEGPLRSIEYDYPPTVQEAPTLQSVELGVTTATLTYALETTTRNRCSIREFHVDGGNYFNFTLNVQDGDEREPVEVQLTGLRANSMYVVRTAVLNSAGWSQYSFAAIQTLELEADVEN